MRRLLNKQQHLRGICMHPIHSQQIDIERTGDMQANDVDGLLSTALGPLLMYFPDSTQADRQTAAANNFYPTCHVRNRHSVVLPPVWRQDDAEWRSVPPVVVDDARQCSRILGAAVLLHRQV